MPVITLIKPSVALKSDPLHSFDPRHGSLHGEQTKLVTIPHKVLAEGLLELFWTEYFRVVDELATQIIIHGKDFLDFVIDIKNKCRHICCTLLISRHNINLNRNIQAQLLWLDF
jgi:hypothetical protein